MLCPICFLNGARHDDDGDIREHFFFTTNTGFTFPHKHRYYVALRIPGFIAPIVKRITN